MNSVNDADLFFNSHYSTGQWIKVLQYMMR